MCSWTFKSCFYCEYPYVKIKEKCALPMHFDDLVYIGESRKKVPDNYRNFNFENLYFMDSQRYDHELRDSGYVHGTVSGKNVGYTGFAKEALIKAPKGKTFSVYSLMMTPAWRKNVTVWLGGYNADELVSGKLISLENPCITQHIQLEDFQKLTKFMICPWGGESIGKFDKVDFTSAAYRDDSGAHVVIDDVIVY